MNDPARKVREPAFNSPWPALVFPAAILITYALQRPAGGPDAAAEDFGFSPAGLGEGRWSGLLTALFVHSGWPHAGLNALGALAFGAPVARWIGVRGFGPLIFFVFYLVCGMMGSLGFALVHPSAAVVLVGASGAVSGLAAGGPVAWEAHLFGYAAGLGDDRSAAPASAVSRHLSRHKRPSCV